MTLDNILHTISQFKNLEKGWNGYDAHPIKSNVIESSKSFIEVLCNNNLPIEGWEVFPTAKGNIQFENTIKDTYIEIEVLGNNTFSYYTEIDGKELNSIVFLGITEIIKNISDFYL